MYFPLIASLNFIACIGLFLWEARGDYARSFPFSALRASAPSFHTLLLLLVSSHALLLFVSLLILLLHPPPSYDVLLPLVFLYILLFLSLASFSSDLRLLVFLVMDSSEHFQEHYDSSRLGVVPLFLPTADCLEVTIL